LIASLELRRAESATFENLEALSKVLFLRGDLLGRIVDHDRLRKSPTRRLLCPVPHARSTSKRSSLGVSIDSRKQARFSIER
jgi:hypothetical protein